MSFNRLATMTALAALIAAPVYATPFCIAVCGGFGSGFTSFVGLNFIQPAPSSCTAWTGYTKTGATVILFTSGTVCLSSNSQVLTVSVSSQDPSFLGAGTLFSDYIQLCPQGASHCPIGHVSDVGFFCGTASAETCTAALQQLPATHD